MSKVETIKCPHCAHQLTTKEGMRHHVRSAHPETITDWRPSENRYKPGNVKDGAEHKCPDCGHSFQTQAWLTRHRERWHPTATNGNASAPAAFICPVDGCGASLTTRAGLQRHLGSLHYDPNPAPVGPPQETIKDILLELLNETEIPAELRLKYSLRILKLE